MTVDTEHCVLDLTCIMSGSGERRLEGGVECLSGDCDPWEGAGTGKRWGEGDRSPAHKFNNMV